MNWSEQAWKAIEAIYGSILEMPFIAELSDGSLSLEQFRFYMAQDSLYLEHFGRALAIVGARAPELQDVLAYTRFAEQAIVVENALHESFFKDFGLTDKGSIQPACHHYVHFLRSTATIEPVEVGMAATLPCFWIYKEVGDYIYSRQNDRENPYQRWIATYGGAEFAEGVRNAVAICNRAAAATTQQIRDRMTAAFVASAHLEYGFWQAAYDLKEWK